MTEYVSSEPDPTPPPVTIQQVVGLLNTGLTKLEHPSFGLELSREAVELLAKYAELGQRVIKRLEGHRCYSYGDPELDFTQNLIEDIIELMPGIISEDLMQYAKAQLPQPPVPFPHQGSG